jgi:hypothetical protein
MGVYPKGPGGNMKLEIWVLRYETFQIKHVTTLKQGLLKRGVSPIGIGTMVSPISKDTPHMYTTPTYIQLFHIDTVPKVFESQFHAFSIFYKGGQVRRGGRERRNTT